MSSEYRIDLVVLQGTPFCNLNCTYCDLSRESRRTRILMAPELIERSFREIFESPFLGDTLTVIWHSGEPLTLPIAYYDDAIGLILAIRTACGRDDIDVRFDIQTNGVLIDEAWCAFFVRHAAHLDLGMSCDGPAGMHDAFRRNWSGRASHAAVVRAFDLLAAHGIAPKVIAVVTDRTLDDPDAFFEFFWERRAQIRGFHFNALADGGAAADPALNYDTSDRERYRSFYRRLIHLATSHAGHDDAFEIGNLTHGLRRILAAGDADEPEAQATAPLQSLNIDANGFVTSFYAGLAPDAFPERYEGGVTLGNILDTTLQEIAGSPKLSSIARDFERSRAACAAACPYFGVCPGGFELTKLARHGDFDGSETPECAIHVKALTDALLDDLESHAADSARHRVSA
ncbi:radical SAM protein [Paracoccus sp. YLB-12]|uniref:Radical SAM protein n=1 Tax=Paracoccus maritimus TaxID=2933292 RepID=A0ABT2KDF8_9RHOB|nr:radical SAM protein [Paracoccus sp. YLB-12]MCT4334401.1 radical SAM protein [Paracoccus sp. YLB-12]